MASIVDTIEGEFLLLRDLDDELWAALTLLSDGDTTPQELELKKDYFLQKYDSRVETLGIRDCGDFTGIQNIITAYDFFLDLNHPHYEPNSREWKDYIRDQADDIRNSYLVVSDEEFFEDD